VAPDKTPSRIEQLCLNRGLKMTDQRRIIAQVLSEASDHPDVDQVYRRAADLDPRISIATVYRTVRLFEEANILSRHDFRAGRARYEEHTREHHDHLINLETGDVIEGLANSTFPMTMPNGFTYHPQNEALLQWFAGVTSSSALGGAFSYPNTSLLTSSAISYFSDCTTPSTFAKH